MRLRVPLLLCCGLVLLGGCSDYDNASRAYKAGRFDEAGKIFATLADAGDAKAQLELSHMKFAGVGGNRDEVAGWSLLLAAAKGGNTEAMAELGIRYESGRGTEKNLILASRWYRLAAHQGHDIAAFNLAAIYEAGIELPKDLLRAYAWFVIAEKKGNVAARVRIDELRSKMKPEDVARADALVPKLMEDPES